MTHSFLAAFQSLLVLASLRLGPSLPPPSALDMPEPRIRLIEAFENSDDWLFDGTASSPSAEAFLLNQAMSRTAGALAQLRGLLSQMAQTLPAAPPRLAALPVFDAAPLDPVLFDAGPQVWTAASTDADLFESLPEFFPRVARDDHGLLRVA